MRDTGSIYCLSALVISGECRIVFTGLFHTSYRITILNRLSDIVENNIAILRFEGLFSFFPKNLHFPLNILHFPACLCNPLADSLLLVPAIKILGEGNYQADVVAQHKFSGG